MLKVMTFNIRYAQADDGLNRWERRRALVIDRIRAFDPDLLGLQECRDDEQAEYVRAHLPDYHFIGQPRGGDGPTALEMAPLLARKDTFDVTRQGCFWLSETPDIPGSRSWDSLFPRTAIWAELTHRATGRELAFLNTHFDLMPEAIVASARLVRQWAERTAARLPLVVCGDFNAGKESAAYALLTDGPPLADAWRQANAAGDDDTSFHAFGQADPPTAIDWILISRPLQATEAAIDRAHRGELYPSDHYPLTAVLRWPG
jgi:endonuclease/exonuclease/phosphatase family metal-dependent hydrolase